MSVYFEQDRGWKYDFQFKKNRYQSNYYKTKTEAKEAEAKKRKELKSPILIQETPTDMAFLSLVNHRLDYLKAYRSDSHYRETLYLAMRWVKEWNITMCSEISSEDIMQFVLKRRKVSNYTANKEIRYLRATFNFGIKKNYIKVNPVEGFEMLPVEKKIKYIPPQRDIDLVIEHATPDVRDYLIAIRDTLARMSEINRLTWNDVSLTDMTVTLYTRKKRGGDLTPRKVPMTSRLYDIFKQRYKNRRKDIPWVFWHEFTSSKTGEKKIGPYTERKKIMRTLCKKAGVRYFRFHALRHASASVMDSNNVPIGSIQRILGHENRTTTEIYLHSISGSEREAIKVLEAESKKSLSKSLSKNQKGL
ncbi:MAG: site-specific integrase [Desulfobacteraceae bacterium]|nr:site-specific integrase [Desulfobacteraceae bacterium]